MRPLTILALAAALLSVHSAVASAAAPLTAQATVSPATLALGDSAEVTVSVALEPGWHINSHAPKLDFLIPTALEFELPEGVRVVRVDYPTPVTRSLRSLSDQALELYEGSFVIRARLVYERLSPARDLAAVLRYQACNDTVCLRPTMVRVSLDLEVARAERHAKQVSTSNEPAQEVPTDSLPFVEFSTQTFDHVRRSRSPFVIEFAADWCAPCREMRERTFRDTAVIEAAHGISFLSVDMTEPDEFVTRVLRSFDVIAAPTTIFFDSTGKEILRKGGFIGPDEFVRLLRRAREPDSAQKDRAPQGA
jgi:DsbC/DsbD-like thiol-disulfide interchange protein